MTEPCGASSAAAARAASGPRRELRKFPAAITRRLAARGYKIERRYVNMPTFEELWRAIERDEPIWVYQCWVVVRKTRQRVHKRAQAPTDSDAKRLEGGGEEIQGGRKP
jgi:hypothetical protein